MQEKITRRRILRAGLLVAGGATAGRLFAQPAFTPSRWRARAKGRGGLPWEEARQIAAETVVPSFPDAIFDVTDPLYGAIGDGSTDNTDAFRAAIEDCSSQGGGHVVVPKGIYSTGAIHLLNDVDFHLEDGALLQFNDNVDN